jgi:hypothetical protein
LHHDGVLLVCALDNKIITIEYNNEKEYFEFKQKGHLMELRTILKKGD